MPEAGLKELLEAGVHFGHQTRRWNPNMRRYIFGELRRDPHHRPAPDRGAAGERPPLRRRAGQRRRHGALRRHQEAGPRPGQGMGRTLQDALRQPALAGRPADQLQHDVGADRPPARADRAGRRRANSTCCRPRSGWACEAELAKLEFNLGGVRDMDRLPQAALRHRPENRGDRGPRGGAPADPDHRPGRHQLRPDPGRLRDPRQRRRDPLLRAGDRHDRRRGREASLRVQEAIARKRGGGRERKKREEEEKPKRARPRKRPSAARPRQRAAQGGRGGRAQAARQPPRSRRAPPSRRSPAREPPSARAAGRSLECPSERRRVNRPRT